MKSSKSGLIGVEPNLPGVDAAMVYFFVRGPERIAYEIRLASDGAGYELVISHNGVDRLERFADMDQLRARERELMSLWSSLGWSGAVASKR